MNYVKYLCIVFIYVMNYVSFFIYEQNMYGLKKVCVRARALHFSVSAGATRALQFSTAAGASAVHRAKPDDGRAAN